MSSEEIEAFFKHRVVVNKNNMHYLIDDGQ
jgi:hypothetical protein